MKYKKIKLQLFAEGAAAPAGDGEGAGVVGTDANVEDSAVPKTRKGKEDPFKDTVFGKQVAEETSAEAEKVEEEAEETKITPKKTYTEEEFKERFNKELKRRFKKAESEKEQMEPILRYMSEEFGVDISDIKSMAEKADEARKVRYRQAGAEKGTDPAEEEKNADNSYELQNYRRQMQLAREHKENDEFNRKMDSQVKEVKTLYPAFDFATEVRNPAFRAILKAGGTVINAYESVHSAEIHRAIRENAVKEAQQRLANNMQANAERPAEGAIANTSGAKVVTDPSNLTKEQRAEIKRRVRRGEKIVW